MTQRSHRVGDLLRTELSELLQREMRDPRVALVTVSRVEMSHDLGFAKVWISALGDDSQRAAALQGIEHARGFLRSQLARRLRLRVVPELHFELDRGPEHSLRIAELLDRLGGERDDT